MRNVNERLDRLEASMPDEHEHKPPPMVSLHEDGYHVPGGEVLPTHEALDAWVADYYNGAVPLGARVIVINRTGDGRPSETTIYGLGMSITLPHNNREPLVPEEQGH